MSLPAATGVIVAAGVLIVNGAYDIRAFRAGKDGYRLPLAAVVVSGAALPLVPLAPWW